MDNFYNEVKPVALAVIPLAMCEFKGAHQTTEHALQYCGNLSTVRLKPHDLSFKIHNHLTDLQRTVKLIKDTD